MDDIFPCVCVYCNRCKEPKSTTRDEVEWRDCCSLHAVIYYSTHTRTNVIYLFYTIKIQKLIMPGKLIVRVCVRQRQLERKENLVVCTGLCLIKLFFLPWNFKLRLYHFIFLTRRSNYLTKYVSKVAEV